MLSRIPRALAVLAALGALALAACGDDDEGSGDSQAPGAPETNSGETVTEAAPDPTDTSVKPVIDRPTGAPPRRLMKEDIVKGKGPGAKPGDTVVVHYVGVSFSTGQEFDASWDAGQPFPVQLGAGQVIPGWERGLVGLREGGRRKLTIPPRLAYGAAGAPPSIAPNETLVFVVDALSVK